MLARYTVCMFRIRTWGIPAWIPGIPGILGSSYSALVDEIPGIWAEGWLRLSWWWGREDIETLARKSKKKQIKVLKSSIAIILMFSSFCVMPVFTLMVLLGYFLGLIYGGTKGWLISLTGSTKFAQLLGELTTSSFLLLFPFAMKKIVFVASSLTDLFRYRFQQEKDKWHWHRCDIFIDLEF